MSVASIVYLLMSIRKKGTKTKGSYSLPWPPGLQINFSKRLRTMFRGINLFGAKINAEFPVQHRAHLFS